MKTVLGLWRVVPVLLLLHTAQDKSYHYCQWINLVVEVPLWRTTLFVCGFPMRIAVFLEHNCQVSWNTSLPMTMGMQSVWHSCRPTLDSAGCNRRPHGDTRCLLWLWYSNRYLRHIWFRNISFLSGGFSVEGKVEQTFWRFDSPRELENESDCSSGRMRKCQCHVSWSKPTNHSSRLWNRNRFWT